jgi:hypothetical protein
MKGKTPRAKSVPVVQLTANNRRWVLEWMTVDSWAHGTAWHTGGIIVDNLENELAMPGDWIARLPDGGFRVYSDEEFMGLRGDM